MKEVYKRVRTGSTIRMKERKATMMKRGTFAL
jgi:hypothetical protein